MTLEPSAAPPTRKNRRQDLMKALRPLGILILLAATLLAAPSAEAYSKKVKAQVEQLGQKYQDWLWAVELLISDEELEGFLGLDKDYQRDAFIRAFWRVRDTYPDTARNEFKDRWYERLAYVRSNFERVDEDRARLFLLNGEPLVVLKTETCPLLWPIEVWFYDGSDRVGFKFFLIFVQERETGPFRMWHPFRGIGELARTGELRGTGFSGGLSPGELLREVAIRCTDGDKIAAAISSLLSEGLGGFDSVLARIEQSPEPPSKEWIETFAAYSTDLPEDAATFPAEVGVEYPGRRQSRTVVQTIVKVPRQNLGVAELAAHRSYNLVLTGEMLLGDDLFDNFRYKFDFPEAEVKEDELPLFFERYLRPGDYRLIFKLEDLNGKRFFRHEGVISVPEVEASVPPPPPADPESARLLAEANAAILSGETTLKIIEPHEDILTGMVRFDTLTTGPDIDRVTFSLDDKPILTKAKAPYSVELDVGSIPRMHRLSVAAFNPKGEEVARDEITLNAGGNRFSVNLIEPRKGKTYHQSLRAEAQVQVPEGQHVERVELFYNETPVATLYQEPWAHPIRLPEGDEMAYVRAVAYLSDGNSTEDLVFVNAPDYLEEIDVQFVELFASVLDRDGHPVEGLTQEDFTPLEDKVAQQISRFEVVRNLPIHAGILLDISASMEDSLDEARNAALRFFEEAVHPKDRATLMTFNDRPQLAVKFTNDVNELAGGLAGLKAERGTSLYDSLIFALYYFNGIKGQRVLLILSDGRDENSRFPFEDAADYARRAGVTVYTVALRDDAAHKKLSQIAKETGGRAFFIKDPTQLTSIYEEIQKELRSRYFIAYQSSNTTDSKDFREIELKVNRPGVEVKTIRGYYP